nr:hypothetical protein [Tanacetum cinerariifolium]
MIFDGMFRNLDNVSGKFLMYPRFIQTFLDKQLDGLPTHKKKYDVSFHSKKVFANMKRISKGDGPRRQEIMRDTSAHTRVISSSDDEALDKEDISKQERIDEIDVDEDTAMVSTHDDELQDEGIEVFGEEEVVEVVTTVKMLIDTVVDVTQVTTAIADVLVSAAKTIVTTAPTITAESTKTSVEVTQAPKRKGVMTQEIEETTTTKTASSQQPRFQDKGKEKAKQIKEPEMQKKRKHQIRANEELAEKLQAKMQAEINEENRLERERVQKE